MNRTDLEKTKKESLIKLKTNILKVHQIDKIIYNKRENKKSRATIIITMPGGGHIDITTKEGHKWIELVQ